MTQSTLVVMFIFKDGVLRIVKRFVSWVYIIYSLVLKWQIYLGDVTIFYSLVLKTLTF